MTVFHISAVVQGLASIGWLLMGFYELRRKDETWSWIKSYLLALHCAYAAGLLWGMKP